jgi:hypothetical protein
VTFRPASVAVTETFLGAAGFAKTVDACEGAMDRDAMSAAAMTAATDVLARRARLLSGITTPPCQKMGVNGTSTPLFDLSADGPNGPRPLNGRMGDPGQARNLLQGTSKPYLLGGATASDRAPRRRKAGGPDHPGHHPSQPAAPG